MALRGVGPESEAESVRFHGRRVTKVGPEVKQLPPEGWGPPNKGCKRRTWALPDVSGGGERHDRFGVVVGEWADPRASHAQDYVQGHERMESERLDVCGRRSCRHHELGAAALVIDPTTNPQVFKFIAAKRASRIGWFDEASLEREFERYFAHGGDGIFWRDAIAEEAQNAKDAPRKALDVLALVPEEGSINKNALLSKAGGLVPPIGDKKARGFIAQLVSDGLLFEWHIPRPRTNRKSASRATNNPPSRHETTISRRDFRSCESLLPKSRKSTRERESERDSLRYLGIAERVSLSRRGHSFSALIRRRSARSKTGISIANPRIVVTQKAARQRRRA